MREEEEGSVGGKWSREGIRGVGRRRALCENQRQEEGEEGSLKEWERDSKDGRGE